MIFINDKRIFYKMKILPIINTGLQKVVKENVAINKALLVAPMFFATSTPTALANDVFEKTPSYTSIKENTTADSYNELLFNNIDITNNNNQLFSKKVRKKISKLEIKQQKYEEKLKRKEIDYNRYNIILKAINGDKDAKKKLHADIDNNSGNRDLAVIVGCGVVGASLSILTGPAALLLSIAGFFAPNHVNNYIVDKKTKIDQKEKVQIEIKKLENEMNDIKNDIKTIQLKISEFK